MPKTLPISTILVPRGAEHRAVLKGLNQSVLALSSPQLPTVIPIPMGPSVHQYLQCSTGFHAGSGVLLMGLGGGLSDELAIGAVTLIERCFADWAGSDAQAAPQATDQEHIQSFSPSNRAAIESDRSLLDWLQNTLGHTAHQVTGVTSQHLISSTAEKKKLHHQFNASVVDMEGHGFLKFCKTETIRGAVVRVISDACTHDVPNIGNAISPEGVLQPIPLAIGLMQQPIAGIRLIRGSMAALSVLSHVTKHLMAGLS